MISAILVEYLLTHVSFPGQQTSRGTELIPCATSRATEIPTGSSSSQSEPWSVAERPDQADRQLNRLASRDSTASELSVETGQPPVSASGSGSDEPPPAKRTRKITVRYTEQLHYMH